MIKRIINSLLALVSNLMLFLISLFVKNNLCFDEKQSFGHQSYEEKLSLSPA
ncbi:MAG: hypothetical protein PHG82_01900 [Candidatus Gracilibacteria bacterium]|nr:hypothetical protein [Candidatus Gracilibacteria bacterium]